MKTDKREGLELRGTFRLRLIGPDGEIKEEILRENLVVDGGVDFICDVMGNPTQPSELDNIGIGWGAGATDNPTAGQTDLQGASKDRNAGTYAHSNGEATFTLQATWAADDPTDGGSINIEESGVFNGAAGNTMLCRQTFTSVAKGVSDTLEVTWTFTIS